MTTMARFLTVAMFMAIYAHAQAPSQRPTWLDDRARFCSEFARRTNGPGVLPSRSLTSIRFDDFGVEPIAKPRSDQAGVGKDQAFNRRQFDQNVRLEAAKGPDFAGRYVVVQWTCGTWCVNSIIADIRTGKKYDPPFAGVVGCERATGEHNTVERKADSRLIVVRGRLELREGEGPCATFYYVWQQDRVRLIGCELSTERSN